MITYETFAVRLLEQVPEFTANTRMHSELYGEILNHVLLGELLRFLEPICIAYYSRDSKSAAADEILTRTLNFIEEAALSKDARVTELVQVSFMEVLANFGCCYEVIASRLGPESRRLFDAAQT